MEEYKNGRMLLLDKAKAFFQGVHSVYFLQEIAAPKHNSSHGFGAS
jgi:hypothetical protein